MDNLPIETRSRIMSAIRSKNTKPELILRKLLFAAGLRYRIHYGKHKIDIAFPSKKIAIFVDGCFWHNCPKHFQMPASNLRYWRKKMACNLEREKNKENELRKTGWKVVRVWEHSLKDNPAKAFNKIASTYKKN
ncbi:MAG: very short patch repair endonuclease [Candidatus ainarchaeum sp.]|nr:very short patch repair endonuclease [Candidatus ainarchaeum sp.]